MSKVPTPEKRMTGRCSGYGMTPISKPFAQTTPVVREVKGTSTSVSVASMHLSDGHGFSPVCGVRVWEGGER